MNKKMNSVTSAETKDEVIANVEVTTSSPNNAKPDVVCRFVYHPDTVFGEDVICTENFFYVSAYLISAMRVLNHIQPEKWFTVEEIYNSINIGLLEQTFGQNFNIKLFSDLIISCTMYGLKRNKINGKSVFKFDDDINQTLLKLR